MRFSVAQLIVFVTIVAFLLAFGGFLLGALERLFIPISVDWFFRFPELVADVQREKCFVSLCNLITRNLSLGPIRRLPTID